MNDLEYEIVKKEKQLIVGLAVRTDNERAMKDIPEVCAKFQEGWQEKITNCVNDDIVCAYLEYDEDFNKPYTYIIGCIVKNADKIPAGMVCKELAGGTYAKVEVFGEYPESLLAAWEDIWDSDIDRSYTTDFELYDQHFTDENDYYFNIYLSMPEGVEPDELDEDEDDEVCEDESCDDESCGE
ncbi:effector binding domain-containing protein [Candidatus Babeliales bacterium]|nr:effector binding domain-containing protein [Candidatus Babeliales bacterium]MBP9844380.1 effector binding domain-containing protein [Candidatus Babeliales bacterium]